jgi:hypothetical protein
MLTARMNKLSRQLNKEKKANDKRETTVTRMKTERGMFSSHNVRCPPPVVSTG